MYAKWTINQYTITFNSNGGSSVEPISEVFGTSIGQPANPTKTGHTFAGWYEDEALTNAYSFPSTMPAGSLTVYAKWTINQYTISFDSNGGTSVSDLTADYGTVITEPNQPTLAGSTFGGWFLDNNTFNTRFEFTTMPAGSLTVYARWLTDQQVTSVVVQEIQTDINNGEFLLLPVSNFSSGQMESAILTRVKYLESYYGVVIEISNGIRNGSQYTFTMTVTKNGAFQSLSNIVATFTN